MIDAQRVDAAVVRFRAFFEELKTAFFEREEVLHQVALALLCREHALLTGPPGTAKSALASAVFGRIVCEESGEPSMYARQITESTVQTDLIGPIDFKNLMETGRTTHFTDEGMLGAVHAFLDEVFDGRDMLLRSALNVLQERELKQGTKITRGRIECALMTTNRYIADVLENARETLLAFVDRIAFIAFVPRGFAHARNMQRVLERHVAKANTARLDALLTIQDLDVLQTLVDEVHVSEPICDAMGELVGTLHAEINQAARSDPQFVPTRYLSTRTAVRSGRVLRAQTVYDRIFGDEDREMQVQPEDLRALRLHFLLGGPKDDEIESLLGQESDPNERRQLEIVRTEREIFERCLGRLKKVRVEPLSRAKKSESKKAERKRGKKTDPLEALKKKATADDVPALMVAVKELSAIASGDEVLAGRARTLLEQAIANLNRAVFRASLAAAADPGPDLLDAIEKFAELATSMGDHTVSLHALSKWLREQALSMVYGAMEHAGGGRAVDLDAALGIDSDPAARTQERLETLRRLSAIRTRLISAEPARATDEERWGAAMDRVEDDVAVLWDAAFCRSIELLLAAESDAALSDILAAVGTELGWLQEATAVLTSLRGSASGLQQRAIGGRLADLVGARMEALRNVDRKSLHAEIETVLGTLASFDLDLAIAPARWLGWCARACVRSAAPPPEPPQAHDYDGYIALRNEEQRVPVAFTLSEVALRVCPAVSETGSEVATDMSAIADLVGKLPESLRAEAAALDLDRISRAVSFLEAWWAELSAGETSARDRLDSVIRSRLFEVLWDDLALARHELELTLVERIFPEQAVAAGDLRERIEALDARTRTGAQALLRERTDEAWKAALAV